MIDIWPFFLVTLLKSPKKYFWLKWMLQLEVIVFISARCENDNKICVETIAANCATATLLYSPYILLSFSSLVHTQTHRLFQFATFSIFQNLLIGNVIGANYTDKEVI